MDIPLPDMMRNWRERDFARGNATLSERLGAQTLGLRRQAPPTLSRARRPCPGPRAACRRAGQLSQAPLLKAWTAKRDLPAPQGKTFHRLYARRERKGQA